MYERILLPTDGEQGVKQATDHALGLARAVGATVHVLYVVDETVYGAYSGDEFVQEHEGPQAALEEHGNDTFAAVTEQAEDVSIETVMRYGIPAEEIVTAADKLDVDLIVLGSRSRSGEFRRLLGSVTDQVLRVTDRPVTVVKTEAKS